MTRDEIALQIFAAMIASGGKVAVDDRLGETQIRVAFMLADTFRAIAAEPSDADRSSGPKGV